MKKFFLEVFTTEVIALMKKAPKFAMEPSFIMAALLAATTEGVKKHYRYKKQRVVDRIELGLEQFQIKLEIDEFSGHVFSDFVESENLKMP